MQGQNDQKEFCYSCWEVTKGSMSCQHRSVIKTCVPVIFEPSEIEDLPHGLNVQQTVLNVSPKTSRVHLDIFNSTNRDIFLPNRTELGRLESVRTVTPLEVKLREPPENDSKDSETSISSPHKVSVSVDSIKTEQSQQQSPDLHHIISDIDSSDLNLEQAQLARKMLLEELDSFFYY